MISFNKNNDPYGWLSNMSPFPVEYEGKTWPTTEHLFQALRFKDQAIREQIRMNRSPMGAKFCARHHITNMVVVPTTEEDMANMRKVLRLKVDQHPGLLTQLLATDGRIVEDCTTRPKGTATFWGAVLVNGEWFGQNVLGKMWMEIRDEAKAAKKEVATA